jgi:hypothetical protein
MAFLWERLEAVEARMLPLLPRGGPKEPVATTAAFADAQQIHDEGEEQWRDIDAKDEK